MSAGMEVQCSIESGLDGASLQESPLRALNGNQLPPVLLVLQTSIDCRAPFYGCSPNYLASIGGSLGGNPPSTALGAYHSARSFRSSSLVINNITLWTTPVSASYSCTMDYSPWGSVPPIYTLQPSGNERIITPNPATQTEVISDETYFGFYYYPGSIGGVESGLTSFTDTSEQYGDGSSGWTFSVSDECDYAGIMGYLYSRLDSFNDWTTYWANGFAPREDYLNQGVYAWNPEAGTGVPYELTPDNSLTSCNGNATAFTTPVVQATGLYIPLSEAIYTGSNGGTDGNAFTIRHFQVKWNGDVPLPYTLIEQPITYGPAPVIPSVILAIGELVKNQILDVPPPGGVAGPSIATYGGVDYCVIDKQIGIQFG